ncbi:MAG TPA: condensation domain-containing protein [Chloroflexota bacterium]
MTSASINAIVDTGTSPAQVQYRYVQYLHPDLPDVRLGSAFRLTGELDLPALVSALCLLPQRHESLRMRAGENPAGVASLALQPALVRPMTNSRAEFDRYVTYRLCSTRQENCRAATWRPVESILFRFTEREHVLGLSVSHLAVDGTGFEVLKRDFWKLYRGLSENSDPDDTERPATSLREEIAGQWRQVGNGQDARRFWSLRLAHCLPGLQMSGDVVDGPGGAVSVTLSLDRIRAVARIGRCSTFVVALTGFASALLTHIDQDSVMIHIPIDLRSPAARRMVGMFAMQLPVVLSRHMFDNSVSALAAVRKQVLDSVGHRYVDPALILELVHARRQQVGAARVVSVVATHIDRRQPARDCIGESTGAGLRVGRFGSRPRSAGFAGGLLFSVVETTDRVTLLGEYAGWLLDHQRAEQLVNDVRHRVSHCRFAVVSGSFGSRDSAAGTCHRYPSDSNSACGSTVPPWLDGSGRAALAALRRELPETRGDSRFWTSGGSIALVLRLAQEFPNSAVGHGDWSVLGDRATIADVANALAEVGENAQHA